MRLNREHLISYKEALREGLFMAMDHDDRVIVIGEGVPDPNAIFGTTQGLQHHFGEERVQDMPLAENGMTGICIGAALGGMRPVLIHQRNDFALLSMDQIVNNAAKWRYLFPHGRGVPLVIRTLIGRGWGQGPQHAQSLQSLFAHIPGLKVIMPTTPADAKGLIISAIEENNPVITFEHRWLYNMRGMVDEGYYKTPLSKAKKVRDGRHITIASLSLMTLEALWVAEVLKDYGLELEIIDMISLQPLDIEPVIASVQKTGHLMVLDTGWSAFGVSAEIIAQVSEKAFQSLSQSPQRITLPDIPTPTSHYLTDDYYPSCAQIAERIMKMVGGIEADIKEAKGRLTRQKPWDIPAPTYTGRFPDVGL
ncbi:alpha-ketoacid dehydrogenase subunit beta [Magnetococcales bacterium HHB-1]